MSMIDIVISTSDNIRTKNFSLYYVVRCLLFQQRVNLNIIIADNGSSDGTSTVLRDSFGQKIGLVDTSSCKRNIARSRNLAARCGQADHIVFLDDDMILNGPEILSRSLSIAKQVDFTCGARRLWAPFNWHELIRCDDPINKVISTLIHTAYEPLTMNRIYGGNILDNRSYIANYGIVSRGAFESVGGFDEEYVGWGYQDTDLMYRLCLQAFEYSILANFGIEVFHLSHMVDKSQNYHDNRQRFLDKQREEGRLFHTNHFFEIYSNDGYSLFSDFPEDKML